MAGTYVGMYDTTAGNNTATGTNSVSIAEGMAPSNVNNAMRDIMADIRQWYNSAEWIEYGDGAGTYTPAYASGTSFTIASVNVTTPYHVGRRVKAVGSSTGTIYGSITATSFSTNTTVTVSWDSGSLSSETLKIYIGIVSASNTSLPETTAITGDYTLDVSGDIILDGDGGDIFFKDGGTTFGSATNTSGNLIIKSGTTTALTFSGANVTGSGTLTIGVDDTGHDVKFFGASAGAFGLYDESENALEIRGATAAGAGLLKLTTGELTVVDADKLGRIDFQAPLESSGTDAILVGASIWAEADDTFAAGVNNTDLVFALGKSEAAAEKFRFTADNEIGIAGANYGTDGQVLTSGGAGAAVAWETPSSGASLTGSTDNTVVTVTGSNAIAGEANFTYNGTDAGLTSGTSTKPILSITNTNTDANGSIIKFIKDAGEAGATNDISGLISFYADDADQNNQEFGRITGRVVDATSGGEEGALDFYVAENDGTVTKGMEIKGLSSDGNITVDVSTHDGAAGGLMLGGTLVTSTATELNKLDGAGTIAQAGKQTIWVPANAMTPTESNGCASIAAVETTSGRPDMYVLDFDKDSDEHAQFTVAFPKQWNLGTVTFQVFWSGTANTGGVSWGLQGVACGDNDTIDVAYGTGIVVDDTEQGAVEEVNVSAASGAVTIAGSPADDQLCYFRIYRDVSDSNDDSSGDARLHGVKIFYTTDAANDD